MKPSESGLRNEKPKRLLLFGSQMETGGAQRVLLNQAAWFTSHGYAVKVVFLYDKENIQAIWQSKADFTIINLFARQPEEGKLANILHLLGGIIRAWHLIWRGKFDAIETFTHHSNLIGLPIAWFCGVPVRIATHHGRIHNFPKWLQKIHSWMVNAGIATKLIAVTEPTRQAAIEEGIHAERVETIFNGVKVPEVSRESIERTRIELGVSQNGQCIISVGRLAPEKGQAVLINAFNRLSEKFPLTHLVLAGGGSLITDLKSLVQSDGKGDRIHFLGVRNDIPELLASSDLFILPSHSEGLPMALLEALSMGIPAVCTAVGGIPSVIVDHKTGRLVPPNDPEKMAQVIAELLSDKNQCHELSQAGKLLIHEKFSIDTMCRKYEKLLFHQTSEDVS